MSKRVVWVSLDPIHLKVDFYPKYISQKLENWYCEMGTNYNETYCILGKDYSNSIVHVSSTGIYFQTTPPLYIGRIKYKNVEYRSVKRFEIGNSNQINVFVKKIINEWRITQTQHNSDLGLNVNVDNKLCIDINNKDNQSKINTWKDIDLELDNDELNVIAWEWSYKPLEKIDDITVLDKDFCIPYESTTNNHIEHAFQNNYNLIIEIPIIGKKIIKFNKYSCYGIQSSLDNSNKILIRRKIVSLKELKQMLHLPMFGRNEINKIISNLPIEMIPDNFFCPILHDIMICPVKTIDGHVYDRNAIISWFRVKNTSPLTGLPLESTLLTPDTELKKEINTFLISLVKLEK
tara:strand:+ start:9631 stop:10674 length:1044 start_codon:yes stop_codon:yes gene_type:complete